MDFVIGLIVLVASIYFAKESYDDQRIGSAMFWASLVGWNIHSLLTIL
jgi:uncharacterized membrane protein